MTVHNLDCITSANTFYKLIKSSITLSMDHPPHTAFYCSTFWRAPQSEHDTPDKQPHHVAGLIQTAL